MTLESRLAELSKIADAASPVVTVYLDTRWIDEHRRDQVRVFIGNEVRQARAEASSPVLIEDLDWTEGQGIALVDQTSFPGAQGAALFACSSVGLREVVPLRARCENAFFVAERPRLRPLVHAASRCPEALVAWIDTAHARIIPVGSAGADEEVRLESEIPGRHRHGGWALLAESRYRRRLEQHRTSHLDAVADTLVGLVDERDPRWVVLAGDGEAIAAFRDRLPAAVAERVAGAVRGAWYEPASVIVDAALELLDGVHRQAQHVAVDEVLTEAAKGGRAIAGPAAACVAVGRDAVHRLYLLESFGEAGVECRGCGTMRAGFAFACASCGGATDVVELGEAMIHSVLKSGGTVESVHEHGALAETGGVAALLRYALTPQG